MTAIRHAIQRELFQPEEERLLSIISVVNVGTSGLALTVGKKKKKQQSEPSFLCLAISLQHPITVKLYQVKQQSKKKEFVKKQYWPLRDVQLVDGINPRKQIPDFELTINGELLRFVVANVAEKEPFIRQMWKLSTRYLPLQRPDFVNVPVPVEEFERPAELTATSPVDEDGISQPEPVEQDYQPISAKEEADFRLLLTKCDFSIANAHKFADQLTRNLSLLDGANIQSIMGSEAEVAELMSVIDAAVEQVESLEFQLDEWDRLLAGVRDAVESMEENDRTTQVRTSNRQELMETLRLFIAAVELSGENGQRLVEAKLSDPANISACTEAAQLLLQAQRATVPQGLEQMAAYKEQMSKFSELSENFAEKLVAHLTVLFQNLVSIRDGGNSEWHSLSLPKHSQRHHALMPFADLLLWLKQTKVEGHRILIERYVTYTKDLYKRDLDRFFESVKLQVKVEGLDKKPHFSRSPSFTSGMATLRGKSNPTVVETRASTSQFENVVDTLLSELDPVIVAEQKFCVRFFHISADLGGVTAETHSIASTESGGSAPQVNQHFGATEQGPEKQFYEKVRQILGQLFKSVDGHLRDFVDYSSRYSQLYVMVMFVRFSKFVLALQDNQSSSYIGVLLGTIVVMVKRRFDIIMEAEARNLGEVKLTKRTRVGVIETVKKLMTYWHWQELAGDAERVFESAGGGRRADLDRWYPQLLAAAVLAIEKTADDSLSKSPPAIVRAENFHALFLHLSELKIACLDGQRKMAKQKYQENLDAYVKEYMGKPLEKLQIFFDQVERCVQQGVKYEEISYQQAFSKQELRRAISLYSAKEVKKGLEQLYRKVEKHLSGGDGCGRKGENILLQVVWRNMQDEFLQQLKHYDALIGRCYSASNIPLEFSIAEVLTFFSEIAMEH